MSYFSELEKEYTQALPWEEYPVKTKVFALNGGHWLKVKNGYKWCTGSTFPRPGGDWLFIVRPNPTPTA